MKYGIRLSSPLVFKMCKWIQMKISEYCHYSVF